MKKIAGIVNIVIISELLLSNTVYAFLNKYDIIQYFVVPIPFFILLLISIISFVFKNTLGYGFLYAVAGLMSAFLSSHDNPVAILFCLMGICLLNKTIADIIIMSLLLILTILRFIYNKYTIFSLIDVIVLYIGCYAVFKALIQNEINKIVLKGARKCKSQKLN